jgi:hypothetical protein
MADTSNVTEEHAARRFHQMARIERAIVAKSADVAACKAHLKALNDEFDGLVSQLRQAARDEGDLPLFDLL